MRYLSVCSGIEAATVAFHPLGWTPVAFAEIEPFPSAVLAHHYPDIPNYGDITQFKSWPIEPIDVLIGGTPCQSFSIAGLRQGIRDPRGNLALVFLGLVDRFRPTWVVWENVPGVHSSWSDETSGSPSEGSREILRHAEQAFTELGLDPGQTFDPGQFEEVDQSNDFSCFLAGLAELGYGFSSTILDAQYFGLAQRRERVFVVGHIGGSWQRPSAVLFDSSCLRRNSPTRRQTRERVAPTLEGRAGRSGETEFHTQWRTR